MGVGDANRREAMMSGDDSASVDVVTWELRVGGARVVRVTVPTPRGDMTMWFAGEFLDMVEKQAPRLHGVRVIREWQPTSKSASGMPEPTPDD